MSEYTPYEFNRAMLAISGRSAEFRDLGHELVTVNALNITEIGDLHYRPSSDHNQLKELIERFDMDVYKETPDHWGAKIPGGVLYVSQSRDKAIKTCLWANRHELLHRDTIDELNHVQENRHHPI